MNKKNFFNLMTMLLVALLSVGFAACSSDDDEDNPAPTPTPSGIEALTTDKVPALGWTGDTKSGIVTFAEEPTELEEGGAIQPYYAFEFSNSQCKEAVYDMVFPNTQLAQQFEAGLKDGTWAEDLDDDDDDFAPLRKAIMPILTRKSTLNYKDLGLPAKRNGKVVYFVLDAFKGKTAADIQSLVNFWAQKTQAMPTKVIVGTWDENKGLYKNPYVFGVGITYNVQCTFEGNFLTKIQGTMTCPNATWAQLMYLSVQDTNEDMEDFYGVAPTVTVSGKTITEVVEIPASRGITKEYIKQMMYYYDAAYSIPIYCMFFN